MRITFESEGSEDVFSFMGDKPQQLLDVLLQVRWLPSYQVFVTSTNGEWMAAITTFAMPRPDEDLMDRIAGAIWERAAQGGGIHYLNLEQLLNAPTSPSERCELLKKRLRKRFPAVRLTFGYTGNFYGSDRSRLRYKFFTSVPEPGRGGDHFGWPRYGVPENELPALAERAEGELETWLMEKVQPHAHNAWRAYQVKGSGVETTVWPWLKAHGADYGSIGGGQISFSIKGITLEELRERFPNYEWDIDWIEKAQD